MLDDPRKGTAVAALGGGGVMVILTYVLFLLHVDVPAPVVAAITGLFGSIAGIWVHSTAIQEDRAALHKFILARLGEQAAPRPPGGTIAPVSADIASAQAAMAQHYARVMPPPGGPVAPIRPSPMGDVRP